MKATAREKLLVATPLSSQRTGDTPSVPGAGWVPPRASEMLWLGRGTSALQKLQCTTSSGMGGRGGGENLQNEQCEQIKKYPNINYKSIGFDSATRFLFVESRQTAQDRN